MVIAVHGGPGARGSMAPVARELQSSFRVLEPFQRTRSAGPLTVAIHVADLHGIVQTRCAGARPAIVGHSWGAMLALAYAAAHPECAGPLVLVGCGTFDPQARARLRATIAERTDPSLRRRLDRLEDEFPDPNDRLRALGSLTLPLYSFDPIAADQETEWDSQGRSHESWDDMVRLQEAGVYPAAFAAIRASLLRYMPQLEYRALERCGHYPWNERFARDEFFSVLRAWLAAYLSM